MYPTQSDHQQTSTLIQKIIQKIIFGEIILVASKLANLLKLISSPGPCVKVFSRLLEVDIGDEFWQIGPWTVRPNLPRNW